MIFSVLAFLSHSWHGPFAFRWNCRSVLYVHHLRHWFDHGETDPRGIHRSPHNPLPRHGRSLPALVETPWWKGEAQRLRDQNWLFYIFVHFFCAWKYIKSKSVFCVFFHKLFLCHPRYCCFSDFLLLFAYVVTNDFKNNFFHYLENLIKKFYTVWIYFI